MTITGSRIRLADIVIWRAGRACGFEQAVAAYESEEYQKALVALPDGVERDFRIIEGID